jgi:hypothetical protein
MGVGIRSEKTGTKENKCADSVSDKKHGLSFWMDYDKACNYVVQSGRHQMSPTHFLTSLF